MSEIKKYMYVRCPADVEYPDEPRDFIIGQVIAIDDFAQTAEVAFYDNYDIRRFFKIPERFVYSLSKIYHCKLEKDSVVDYLGRKYRVVYGELSKKDGMFYYRVSSFGGEAHYVCEDSLTASFNDGAVSPRVQMMNHEFQHPMWYFGRVPVNKAAHEIDNAVYGLKELAGCKIYLKPHQLKTALRCLSESKCRYMIADEVGMGKTIETLSVLKIFLSLRRDQRILIITPDSLTEQWRTEMAFKFKLFEGENAHNNHISLVPLSKSWVIVPGAHYDFLVVDEVHRILSDARYYSKIMNLSKAVNNVIMLSATPVQSRGSEYHKLLSLIQPQKYENMSDQDFEFLLELQNWVVRSVSELEGDVSAYKEALDSQDEEAEDIFDDICDTLESIARKTKDKSINNRLQKMDYDSVDHSLSLIEKTVAYICESYQLEKCVIRNRRSVEDKATRRELIEFTYDLQSDFNNTEYLVYMTLSEWIDGMAAEERNEVFPLVGAFFSSSAAFASRLRLSKISVPEQLEELSMQWLNEEKETAEKIEEAFDEMPDDLSRLMTVINYIDQEAFDKKVILFTHYAETFDLYKTAIEKYFGGNTCAFFARSMAPDDLELNTYRFQTSEKCRVMLSDETGGEGRNFQNADELINIDMPWSANTLEQRIGRLDRIGRDIDKPVVTVNVFTENTPEESLSAIWRDGLGIFEKSQSGLEIIMNDVDQKIRSALAENFKYGLSGIIGEVTNYISDVEKKVKMERHFDLAAYRFQNLNRQIERYLESYHKNESEMFRKAMMSWATMAGFKRSGGQDDGEGDIVRFDSSSFSPKSAKNTLFVPPDMKAVIDNKMNQMRNRVRILNGDRQIRQNNSFIQGTFNRPRAIADDYLNFFAPGDEIFDSIVNNAIRSYKGKCAAFAVRSDFEWEGFVLT